MEGALPCPFCAGEDLMPSFHQTPHHLLVCVACDTCNTEGPTAIVNEGDRKSAITQAKKSWNVRHVSRMESSMRRAAYFDALPKSETKT